MFKFATALAVLALPCLAGEPVELVYKFDAEKPIAFEMVQEMNQNQAMQGMTMETTSVTTSSTRTELLEANEDGSVLIRNTTDRIGFTMSAPGVEMSYDSAEPADQAKLSDPTIASVAGMVGMGVELLIASDGTVLDVPNVAQLQKNVDAMKDPGMRAALEQMMGKESLIALNEMNYKLLPTRAVEVGEQWSRMFDIPLGFGAMTMSFDLTLDEVKKGIASISIDGSMSMTPIEQQGVTVTMNDAQVDGSMRFDIEDGVANFFELSTVTGMVGTMASMPDPIMTMTMTNSVKNTRLDD